MFRSTSLILVAVSATMLAGCVVAPYGPPPGAVYAQPLAVAPVAPPPPYEEVVPVAPFVGALWIGGYWGWSNNRHVWVPGRWEHPRAGYVWEPHRWVARNGHWHLEGGNWRAH